MSKRSNQDRPGQLLRWSATAALGLLALIGGAAALNSVGKVTGARDLTHRAAAIIEDLDVAARAFDVAGLSAMRDYAQTKSLTGAVDGFVDRLGLAQQHVPDPSAWIDLVGVAVFEADGTRLRFSDARLAGRRGADGEVARASARLAARFRGAARNLERELGDNIPDGFSQGLSMAAAPRLLRPTTGRLAGLDAAQAWIIWPLPGGDGAFAALAAGLAKPDAGAMSDRSVAAEIGLSFSVAGASAQGGEDSGLIHVERTAPIADGRLRVVAEGPPRGFLELDISVIALPALLSVMAVAALLAFAQADRARHAQMRRRQSAILKSIASKQRQLEASEERFRQLAQSTNVIPWTADLDRQTFTFVGSQIEALSGYPSSAWTAPGFWAQHVHPKDRQEVVAKAAKIAGDGSYTTIDYRIRAGNGRILHVRNIMTRAAEDTAAQGGKTVAKVAHGFMLDVTELKHAAAALEVARRKAEDANRVKSEFLASMSHELRTPLNAVIGFSEIMKEELFGPLDPQYREYAESVHASGRHLLDLINDVLDLSKIEAGRIELAEEETDLRELLAECRTLLRERLASAGLHEVFDVPAAMPDLVMDGRRVKQVVLNLLSNAIKFTQPGGEVALFARHEAGRGVLIGVRDTGIGMTAEEIPKALTKFGQIDGELSRKHDGTGLGLPIAKSLIEMHGGRLEVHSEKGKGTEMHLWLPETRIVSDAA